MKMKLDRGNKEPWVKGRKDIKEGEIK